MKQPILLVTILLTLGACFTHALAEPEESMILYVSFDTLDGKKTIDHSKYGNNGDLMGDPEHVDGKHGKALQFDGESDWVEIPHHESLTVDKNVTVMAWINIERHSGPDNVNWQGIVSKGNSPRSYSFYTHLPTQCLHFTVGPPGAFTGSTCNTPLPLNEWVHVAAHQEDGVHRYFINGKNVSESGNKANLPGLSDTSNVFIGTTAEGASRRLLGLIDEVRIWNRALSEDEVVQQMNKGFDEFFPDELFPVDPRQKLSTTWATIKSRN